MKHTKKVCRCEALKFPHRFDVKRCIVYEDEPSDYSEDQRLDDPRHGQADADNRMEAIYRGRWER